MPELNIGRMGHKMVEINGKPTVIGGFDSSELNSVEEFDGNSWSVRSEVLPYGVYLYGSADDIPEDITCA